MINAKINGTAYQFDDGATVLNAARSESIKIPTLCFNDYLKPYGGCRLCLVEQSAKPGLVPACTTVLTEGMEITTESPRINRARTFVIELLLSRCPDAQKLRDLADEYAIPYKDEASLDVVGRYLLFRAEPREKTNCVLCGLCVRVCQEITERHALSITERGISRKVVPPFAKPADTCIGCGSCAYVCPTKTVTVEEVT